MSPKPNVCRQTKVHKNGAAILHICNNDDNLSTCYELYFIFLKIVFYAAGSSPPVVAWFGYLDYYGPKQARFSFAPFKEQLTRVSFIFGVCVLFIKNSCS